MKLSDILSGLGRTIAYYPGLARIIGVKECVLLCQLIYWRDKSSIDGGWVYKSRLEILNETGLSHEEQETVRKNLKESGLLEDEYKRAEHKLYLRVNLEALDALWVQANPGEHSGKDGEGIQAKTACHLGKDGFVYKDTRVPTIAKDDVSQFPAELRDTKFIAAWTKWKEHLRGAGKGMGAVQQDELFKTCIRTGAEQATKILNANIQAGYKRIVWNITVEEVKREQVFRKV